MKLTLPSDVYRVLAVLKAEGTSTVPGIADVLDMDEKQAEKIVIALCLFSWAYEQILFDGSSEYMLAHPYGDEVLSQSPLKLNADGYVIPPPPVFRNVVYKQQELL